jgi:hypothetical protein
VPLQQLAPNAELSLATDAFDTNIGGVMQRKSGDHWRPLGFFSRKLIGTKSRYSTLTVSYWLLRQQSKIFVIFVKVVHSNFVPTTNPLLLLCHVFQPPFHPDNDAIWRSFQSSMYNFCTYQVGKMSLLIFFPAPYCSPLQQLSPRRQQIQWNGDSAILL